MPPDVLAEELRAIMRQAYQAMMRGEDPTSLVEQAMGVEGRDRTSAAQSLQGRRLLRRYLPTRGDSEQRLKEKEGLLDSLRQRIGDEAFGIRRSARRPA